MTPWLSLLVVRALLAVSSPLYRQRPDPVSPRCYVRPVLPTGHPAVFLLDKGKAIGSLSTPSRLERTRTPSLPHLPRRSNTNHWFAPPSAPRFESRKCDPRYSLGRKKDRFAHKFKVANRSGVVAESSPARAGAQRSEREKGGEHAPGDSKGHSPWRAFGDFPRVGKVTRVQGGAPASGVAGATNPA